MPHDPSLPALFDRDRALTAGVTPHQIAQRVRSGAWLPLRRHIYAVATQFTQLPLREQHVLRTVAILMARGENDVASHLSGAVVHGWPLPFDGPGAVTVTSGNLARSARRRDRLIVQVATLPESDVRTVHAAAAGTTWPVAVTSPARTLADCLRHLDVEDSVAIGDAALRSGHVVWDGVRRVLDRQEPWPYLARGREALALLDPRRESYLESFSFVRLGQRGVRGIEPQVTIRNAEGQFVARVDGWIGTHAIALEADGAAKYLLPDDGRLAPEDPLEIARVVRRTMAAQVEREQRLTALGVRVLRWGTADALHRPDELAARIAAACRRPAPPFTGTATRSAPPPWQPARDLRPDLCATQPGFSRQNAG